MEIAPETQKGRALMFPNKKKALLTIKKLSKSRILPYAILFFLIISYTVFFSILSIDRHNRFASLAFDLGIFDQAIWQFSTFSAPFNTVRGIHIFGDHLTPINALISPIYWLFDNVRLLLVLQSLALASAAIPLFLIARHYFKNKWIPLIFVVTYLLFPALHYVNLEDYHPEAFIPVLLLSAFYFIQKGKRIPYFTFIALALLTREETALTTFMIGIYAYFVFDKKTGLVTSALSLAWFLIAIKLIIPLFNDASYWHATRVFSEFGSTPLEIISHAINPAFVFSKVFTQANAAFLWGLFAPVGFLSLLNPATLLISAYLWVNLIAAWPYSHSIHYHYVIPIIPFVFLSAVIGVARFKTKKAILYPLLTLLLLSSLSSNYHIAPFDSSMKNYQQITQRIAHFNSPSESEQDAYSMLALIPSNAPVTASYHLVPHLSHRKTIYNFPNPFKEHYWGDGTKPPPQDPPEFILLREAHVKEHATLIESLLKNNTYVTLRRTDEFALFALRKPPIEELPD